MKKLALSVLVIFIGIMNITAQSNFIFPEGKEVVVYSLPQTELCIEIEIEKETQTPGNFYLYSERYLATQNVITENKVSFRLKNISVKANAIADPNRTYSIPYSKNSVYNSISVDERGLLCGLNVPCCEAKAEKDTKSKDKRSEAKGSNELLPLTEEYMMAGSTSKMAEGAAKTIYRIRESRINLLTGDVDQLPDGNGMKEMLKQMNRMEKELTELFIGKTKTETQKHKIYITPATEMKDHVLFRFSNTRGLVGANDLSGSPYYLNVLPEMVQTQPLVKKGSSQNELFHLLPARTQVSVNDGKNTFFSETMNMPQFGKEIPFPADLIQKKGVKIKIDSQTGRLLKVEE
ncbi:DUF4831 family protein [Paludibacteraceae bacterium OttesenSCG-928-F17]|nr:DUF4831 family protein [Paludibacteraceae bacterium OttesenSCG-928-F17]